MGCGGLGVGFSVQDLGGTVAGGGARAHACGEVLHKYGRVFRVSSFELRILRFKL